MVLMVFCVFFLSKFLSFTIVIQGERTQSVKSNFALTEGKNAIKFNLKVDSDQGSLGIYAWMNTFILS